jgi:WD40 repeat protein
VDKKGVPRTHGSGGGKDRTARIFDSKTGRQLRVLAGDWRTLHSASWGPDGRRVCTVHEGSTIRVWDVATGKEVRQFIAPPAVNPLNSAAFSPDGRRLMAWCDERSSRAGSGAHGNVVRVWDVESGKALFSLKRGNGAVWSPDGKRIVTSAYVHNTSTSGYWLGVHGRVRDDNDHDRTARVWDAGTGALLFVLQGHTQSVHSAEFSKDGRRLVTASEDRTARVWDVASGKELITLRGHEDDVKTARFSADGEMVLTVSWDGSARLWPVDPLPLAQARRPRELTGEERERFGVTNGP